MLCLGAVVIGAEGSVKGLCAHTSVNAATAVRLSRLGGMATRAGGSDTSAVTVLEGLDPVAR